MTARPARIRTVAAGLIVVLAGLPACSRSSSPGAATPGPAGASGWAADVDALVAALERSHPNPYHSIAREDFTAAALEYGSALPEMSEWEAVTGFQSLLALLAGEGRDGHMVLVPADRPGADWRMFPIQLYWFADGIYVVAARDDPSLVGAKLVSVGNHSVREAVAAVEPLITKDNALTVRARVPAYLEAPDLLTGLGLIEEEGAALTFEKDGERIAPEMTAIGVADHEEWRTPIHPYVRRLPRRGRAPWLQDQDDNVTVRYLPRGRTLYVGFNFVLPPFDDAVARIGSILDTKPVARVAVDLRHNPGGETGTYGPLLEALDDPRVDRPGRLFALTGRVTFSAAANFLADLDNRTCVLVAGEPPGAAPRFWDDNSPAVLPHSGFVVPIATRWWGKGGARHRGTTFEVDVPVDLRSDDYFSGRDPVLARIMDVRSRTCP